MKTNKSNRELLLKIREGDRVAFYNIYERYCKKLYGFVLRYIKVEADAEEIVQEVFVKIWESRSKLNTFSSFDSFVFTIAYNTSISLLRKRANEKKYIAHLQSLQQILDAPEVIDELQFKELDEKLNKLLDKLTPRQKEIFKLSREDGLSHDEIAKKLNISVNTVKKHMVNTLAFLKTYFDKDMIVSLLFVYFFLF